jgi:flagellar basal body-associated protein FliL
MKNIFIILALIVVFMIAGFLGTAKTVMRRQEAQARKTESPVSGETTMEAVARAQKEMGRTMADSEKRQTCALIGGGIGGVVGFVLGIGIVILWHRRKKNLSSQSSEATPKPAAPQD